MTLTVICPTRGRPQSAAALSEAFEQTSAIANLVFAADLDDPRLEDYYLALAQVKSPYGVVTAPRMRMGPTLNLWARRYATIDPTGVVGFCGDDHRPRTPGWDVAILDELAKGPGVVYGDDLIHGQGLATAAFMSSPIINQLGYMAPPGLIHMFLDNAWLEIGRATRLIYRPDLVFEHLHPLVGKAESDAGYVEVNSFMEQDRIEYERWLATEWVLDRLKVGHRGS